MNKSSILTLGSQVIGGSDAMDFSMELRTIVEGNIQYVIVDMSKVELINSSGLGMLVSGLSTMKKAGGTLKLACVSAKVKQLLEMTHLNTVLNSYHTIQEAEESCK
ncbi:MAG: STAS domain-containing protein [Ignavibacteria bacterium]|nr:STAS domain-containing protein [Ignavibacteria bacterium]